LQREAHHGDGVLATRSRAALGAQFGPGSDEVLFHDGGLCLDGELVQDGEGADERVEHGVGELENELLGAAQWGGLSTREIGEPVHKVESDIVWCHVLRLHHVLELGKERRGRGLPLHQPSVVEAHLGLREADRLLADGA